MAQTNIHSIHQRVSGGTEGTTGSKKMDGYAKGPVPKSMVGVKVGADPDHPYTGPDVAHVGGK